MKYIFPVAIFFGVIFSHVAAAQAQENFFDRTRLSNTEATELPWAILGYWGQTTDDTLGAVVGLNFTTTPETLYSLEFTHVLPPENALRRFFQPLVSTVELNANFTYRDDPAGSIYEVNPYFSIRWTNFPWNKFLPTTFAIGEGVSYDSSVPSVEVKDDEDDTNNLLNFIMLEATFALPKYPQLELVLRAHHRSGVFGFYQSENTGSTAVGLGVRYRF